MDNFRRPKRVSTNKNVDGMINRRAGGGSGSLPSKTDTGVGFSRAGNAKSRIGNFGRAEGFISRQNKPSQPDGRSLGRRARSAAPIDMTIDESKSSKRGKVKKNRNWKKIALRTFAGLAALFLIVGGYLGIKAYLRAKQVFKGGGAAFIDNCEPDVASLHKEGDGRVNVLILGKGGPSQPDGPDLTDTIIVASIDPCNKEAGLLSIPRDLAVKADSGETMKINAIYAIAKMNAKAQGKSSQEAEKIGLEAIEKVTENVTGIQMNRYVMLDFTAFEQAINAVGGIDINIKTAVYEPMQIMGKPYYLKVPKGQQHFDGLKALAYSRSRHTSLRGDFDRSERQRDIIIALKNKVLSLGTFSNPAKISQLIDAFGSRVQTNMSLDEISKFYSIGQQIDSSKVASISLVDEPNVLIATGSASLGLGSIQVPVEGLYRYDEIRTFIRTKFLDGFIRKENPAIVVLNGTTVPGLANLQTAVLKSYGYNVIKKDTAPDTNTPNTILVDLRSGQKKYTRRYLEQRYKTTAVTELPKGITPPENADFVIILGQNEASNQ